MNVQACGSSTCVSSAMISQFLYKYDVSDITINIYAPLSRKAALAMLFPGALIAFWRGDFC